MKTILEQAHKHAPGKLIYLALQGSRLYGTHRSDSDYDLRVVYLPPLIDLLDSRQKDALSFQHEDENLGLCEITLWSFPFWLRLLHSGDTNATDLYFAFTHPRGVLFESGELKHFRATCQAKSILPRDLKGMRGYVRSQALKYGAKGQHFQAGQLVLESATTFNKNNDDAKVRSFWAEFLGTAEGRKVLREFPNDVHLITTSDNRDALEVLEKVFYLESPLRLLVSSLTPIVNAYGHRARAALEGADWKALSHSLRVLDEVIELHQTGQVSFPLAGAELLAKVKRGEVSHDEVMGLLEQREEDAGQAELASVLSSQGNRELLDRALLEIYGLTTSM
jgi:RNA repair pathway DNA polymerase beta family